MPCGDRKSGYTTGKGESIIKPSAQFVVCCRKYDGKYPAKTILKDKLKNKRQPQENGMYERYQSNCGNDVIFEIIRQTSPSPHDPEFCGDLHHAELYPHDR